MSENRVQNRPTLLKKPVPH